MKNCNITNNIILRSLESVSENSFFNTTSDSEQVLSLFCVSLFPQDILHHFLKRGKKEENWVWEGDSSRWILFFFSLNLQIFSSIYLKKFTTFINQLATLDVDNIKYRSIRHYSLINMKICDEVKNIYIGKQRTILSEFEINEKGTISKGKVSLSFSLNLLLCETKKKKVNAFFSLNVCHEGRIFLDRLVIQGVKRGLVSKERLVWKEDGQVMEFLFPYSSLNLYSILFLCYNTALNGVKFKLWK